MTIRSVTVDDIDFLVEFDYTPLVAAVTHLAPEDCSPAEGGDIELTGVMLEGYEMLPYLNSSTTDKIVAKLSDCLQEIAAEEAENNGPEYGEDDDDR